LNLYRSVTLNPEERRRKIIRVVESHEGYSPEQCFKELESEMARSTFFGHLAELKNDKIVISQHANKRDQKLFLNKTNIFISTQDKLEEFDKVFTLLIDKIGKKLLYSALAEPLSALTKKPTDPSEILSNEQASRLTWTRLTIFFRMIDSILLQSLIVWPKRIEDKETLKKLQVSVFSKIIDMIIKYSEKHMDADLWIIRQEHEIFKRLRGSASLLEFQTVYEEAGMKREIDDVLNSLWNIDKDIRHLAYKEKEMWGLDLKDDDGKKLLTLIKDRLQTIDD
jgi:DNA-binding transcriptional ArsR family regulator